jgi:uncharacterized protein with FMN-binding domain
MRKAVLTLFLAAALSLPIVDATAAVRTATKKIVATKTFNGPTTIVSRWGELYVTIKVRKTTTVTGKTKKVSRRIIAVGVPVYPNHTDRSVFINEQAIPLLTQEVLTTTKFNPNIQLVGGATATSYAFAQSLQAALIQAKKI